MTQRYEIEAWLGDAAGEMTDKQISDMHDLITAWEADHPNWAEPDESFETEAAWIAAYDAVTGALDLPATASDLLALRTAEREGYCRAVAVAYMAARQGTPEAKAAREAGIDRMSLRKALGK